MHKVTKFLLIVLAILLIIYFWINGYIEKATDIESEVGARVGGGELTVSEYYTLVQCFDTYKNYIAKGDYKTAYSMLGNSYKSFVTYDDFVKMVSGKNWNGKIIKDVNIITTTTFDLLVDESGEEEHYSIVINKGENNFRLYPESFLDYKNLEMEESSKKLKCTLKDYIVNIDKTIFNLSFENTGSKDSIEITKATLYTNQNDVIDITNVITVQPEEIKELKLEFNTDYTFPTKLILERKNGDKKPIMYSFEIK